MYFVLTNALFDASIAAWDAKRAFDSVRPATAIPYLFHGQQIRSWGGPNQGTIDMDGSNWIPYQPGDFPTPPFPEYVSGHSTFSAAAATVLQLLTHSDRFGDSATFPAGSSLVEPGTVPAAPLTLYWKTFSEAADQAGISRRYGGIHFKRADLVGRAVGRLVGANAYAKAVRLFEGRE
jgi:PAP2 superfamily